MEKRGEWKGKAKVTAKPNKQLRLVAASATAPMRHTGLLQIREPRLHQPVPPPQATPPNPRVSGSQTMPPNPRVSVARTTPPNPAVPPAQFAPPIPVDMRSLESLLQSENASQEVRDWFGTLSGPSRHRLEVLHQQANEAVLETQNPGSDTASESPTQRTPTDPLVHPPSQTPTAEESSRQPAPSAVESAAQDQRMLIFPVGPNRYLCHVCYCLYIIV